MASALGPEPRTSRVCWRVSGAGPAVASGSGMGRLPMVLRATTRRLVAPGTASVRFFAHGPTSLHVTAYHATRREGFSPRPRRELRLRPGDVRGEHPVHLHWQSDAIAEERTSMPDGPRCLRAAVKTEAGVRA